MLVFFFFKQKTAYEMRISDWSSDVCSSDLDAARYIVVAEVIVEDHRQGQPDAGGDAIGVGIDRRPRIVRAFGRVANAARQRQLVDRPPVGLPEDREALAALVIVGVDLRETRILVEEGGAEIGRSEERRVGKECVRTFRTRG